MFLIHKKKIIFQFLLGILDTIKEVAVGWSSDGASVMLGKNMKGGAAKKFEKSIGQKLHKTWVSFKCKLIAFSCKSTL